MKKRILHIYEWIVIIFGIGIPIYLSFLMKPLFPPFYQYSIYLIIALASAYLFIEIYNTIVSFEIAIYYFFLLSFGPLTASLTAIFVIVIIWTYKAFKDLKLRGRKYFRSTIKSGMYNSGVYGGVYLSAGLIYRHINKGGSLFTIFIVILLNEIFFSVYAILSGSKYLSYLKNEGLRSDLIELAVYPFGISMYLLYRHSGFISTIPLVIGIILLSYIGNRMSSYQITLGKRLTDIKKLNKISQLFSSIIEVNTLLRTILEQIFNMVKPDSLVIYVESPYENKKIFYHYNGKIIKELDVGTIEEYKDIVQIPLLRGNTKIGFVGIISEKKLSREELALAENISEQAAINLTNAMLYKISIEDPLTGLYTRRHFESRLEEEIDRSVRIKVSFTVVIFDIDNFKQINDNFGHKIGDEILQRFAKILGRYTRAFDICARWGGDEFILILPGTSELQALDIAERIKSQFSSKLEINGKKLKLSVTYGLAEYIPDSGEGPEEIFHRADHKLILAKKKLKSKKRK